MTDPRNLDRLRKRCVALAARLSAAMVAIVGLIVLFGWLARIEAVTRVIAGLVAMNPATAIAFVVAGASLLLLDVWSSSPRLRRLGQIGALLVLIIGLLNLAACLGATDLRVDQWLFQSRLSELNNPTPNRMTLTEAETITVISFGSIMAFVLVALSGSMIRRDIAARRKVETALREAEERSRLLIEGLRDYAVIMLDPDGKIVSWNSGAERIKGYKAEEIVGRHFSHFYIRDDLQHGKPERELRAAAEKGRYEEEGWRVRKDGKRFWANVVISAVRDHTGALRGFAKVTRDVTERKHAVDEIRQLNESLRQHAAHVDAAKKELESFSYSVSHDLRAPLRSIDGFSQVLMEDFADKLGEEGKGTLQRVRAATQRMGQLIDDMLNLSRVTRSEMRYERVDLTAMARAVVAELEKNEPDRVVGVVIDDAVTAQGDARLLRVVLDNLLGNAWKFTGRTSPARIEFGTSPDGAFYVRDNGAGFDMTYAAKLFGAFQRLHAMNEFSGTGIGLATVQRIIQRHGGRVWAQGAVGEGAAFFFTVPTADGSLRQAA